MEKDKQQPGETRQPRNSKNKVFGIVLAVLLLAGAAYGIIKYVHSLHHQETENAQVQADISPVIPRVAGYVEKVLVEDHQQVSQGDTLLILDDRDLLIAVKEAEAALAMAQSNLAVSRRNVQASGAQASTAAAGISAAAASIEAARVDVWRANQDFERYANLVEDHSVTRQQYEQALAAKQAAELRLQVLEEQEEIARRKSKAAESQTGVSFSQIEVAEAQVRQREAALSAARLQLSYAVITAPASGHVSEVEVEPGQFIQPGQRLFSVVMNGDLWVVANFKETQLRNMEKGQPVDIEVDAFPGHAFRGVVSSFSPATGARFALLPPDNATGNFVKVVQRVPVKINLEDTDDPLLQKLRVGMNAEVDVHIN